MLVHSFLYYQMDTSIVADTTYDKWSKELANLMKNNKEITKKSVYYKDFKDFDGSSGYDLPFTNPEIQSKGYQLLKIYKNKIKG